MKKFLFMTMFCGASFAKDPGEGKPSGTMVASTANEEWVLGEMETLVNSLGAHLEEFSKNKNVETIGYILNDKVHLQELDDKINGALHDANDISIEGLKREEVMRALVAHALHKCYQDAGLQMPNLENVLDQDLKSLETHFDFVNGSCFDPLRFDAVYGQGACAGVIKSLKPKSAVTKGSMPPPDIYTLWQEVTGLNPYNPPLPPATVVQPAAPASQPRKNRDGSVVGSIPAASVPGSVDVASYNEEYGDGKRELRAYQSVLNQKRELAEIIAAVKAESDGDSEAKNLIVGCEGELDAATKKLRKLAGKMHGDAIDIDGLDKKDLIKELYCEAMAGCIRGDGIDLSLCDDHCRDRFKKVLDSVELCEEPSSSIFPVVIKVQASECVVLKRHFLTEAGKIFDANYSDAWEVLASRLGLYFSDSYLVPLFYDTKYGVHAHDIVQEERGARALRAMRQDL